MRFILCNIYPNPLILYDKVKSLKSNLSENGWQDIRESFPLKYNLFGLGLKFAKLDRPESGL